MLLTLRIIGLVGAAVFGLAFAITLLSPIQIERAARGFILAEIDERVGRALGSASEARVGRAAEILAERKEIASLRERLATPAKPEIAAIVDRMQAPACDCRKAMLQAFDATAEKRISTLERAELRLRRMVEGHYGEVVAGLLRDMRIFTGVNLIAFLMLLALSVAKPSHVRQLFVPAILLGISAMIASGFYLLGQDWFFTLLYGDFVGWAYAIWLLLIFALLCDVALFKARITMRMVNAVQSVFGTAVSVF